MFWKATEQYCTVVYGSKHAMSTFFRKPTSGQYFLYGVVCFVIECVWEPTACSNSSFSCPRFFPLVMIYQIESLITVGILSISLFYNSESIDILGLKGHINC